MRLVAFLILISLPFSTVAQVDPIDANGIAIGGYDPVSYFTTGMPTKGSSTYASKQGGVSYLFSSKDNQKRFEANPKQYTPQYDGYCALAVSYGKKISIDPETFKIINGKLYLLPQKNGPPKSKFNRNME